MWPESHLTHWGRVTQICVGNLTIIGSDNGLSPGRHQAITWTNAGLLLIRPWGTNFSEILIGIQTFSFKKMHLKMSSAKWRNICLGLNVLNERYRWSNKFLPAMDGTVKQTRLQSWCINNIVSIPLYLVMLLWCPFPHWYIWRFSLAKQML